MALDLKTIVEWTKRLAPGLVMLSLIFVLDGGLRWLGLFGVVLLVLAFRKDVPNCACEIEDKSKVSTWRSF